MSVYFIRDDRGRIKIGHAIDPWQRLQILQCASSNTLALIRVVEGGQKVERWLHRHFADRRVRGEWFSFTEEMLTIVVPDEIPRRRPEKPAPPRMTIGEYLRGADAAGVLSDRMKQEYAPLLRGGA